MAIVKWKIDENWNGIVLNNGVEYVAGETFSADESLGENRPWLIKQAKNAQLPEKVKDEKKPKEKSETKVEDKEDDK
jgi:hypothetical protein